MYLQPQLGHEAGDHGDLSDGLLVHEWYRPMPFGSGHVAPIRFVAHGSHEGETFGVGLGCEIGETTGNGIRHRAFQTLVLDGNEEADQCRRCFATIRVTQGLVQIADNSPCQFVQRLSRSISWVADPSDAIGQLLQRDMKVCSAHWRFLSRQDSDRFACVQCTNCDRPGTNPVDYMRFQRDSVESGSTTVYSPLTHRKHDEHLRATVPSRPGRRGLPARRSTGGVILVKLW